MNDELFPVLPYAGSSGWSGTDTSKERADRADRSGRTSFNQRKTLSLLRFAGSSGLTWKDLSRVTDWHHGSSSGCLTALHKQGRIARLLERREGCRVYVLTEFVGGRDTDLPAVRMSQNEMYRTLCYLHRRAMLLGDHDGVRVIEEQLGKFFPQWSEEVGEL